MTSRVDLENKKIIRHSLGTRLTHWAVTVSTFLLIFTGFAQFPIYRRYSVDQLPGLSWSTDWEYSLIVHYLAAGVLMFAAVYHVVFHGVRKDFSIMPRRGDIKESYLIIKATLTKGKVPPCDKYLAEQRLAFVFIAGTIGLLIVTGVIKVLKNLLSVNISEGVLFWTTWLHTFGTVLIIFGIIAHLGAFIFKENWPLLPTMFTGKVDLEYVKHRHCLWYDDLCRKLAPEAGTEGLGEKPGEEAGGLPLH